MIRFTLTKEERLSSQKEIELLFEEGKSLSRHPIRIIWRKLDLAKGHPPAQVLFSVSKRKFSKAVERNRIKRLMRESYRLSKPAFYESIPQGMAFHIAIIFIGNEMADFYSIQTSMAQALNRLITSVANA